MPSDENIHWQVVGALASLEGKEAGEDLLSFVGGAHRATLEKTVASFSSLYPEGRSEEIVQQLQAWHASEDFSGLAEIHPAWLLEVLKEESPRVIGIVLRHLPSRHVRFLLEHFPRRLCMELPKLIEAFYVPSEILQLLRRRVERHFVPMRISRQITSFSFNHLTYLKIPELEALFYDLGLSELSLSLIGSTRKIWKVILNRFLISEAKAILKRIKRHQGEAKWFLKEARYSILELSGEERGPCRFLRELGLVALAKAIDGEETFVKCLGQKMEPKEAYLLKRYWEGAKTGAAPGQIQRRQEWVLEHVRRLSEEGKIDPFWATCFIREAAA